MENGSLSHNGESRIISSDSGGRRGGWITFPIIAGAVAGLSLAAGAWLANLIVFLIQEFNIKSIDATQITNIVNGCFCFIPVIGSIIADSFFGSFLVITVSSCISLLDLVLFTLTVTLGSLKPQPCVSGSELCEPTSNLQYAILYTALALASIGLGGTRFTLATMGANQFDEPKSQASFFNWYFFSIYTASVVSFTVIVYVEDNVGWKWGFGIGVIANLIGLAIFVSGTRFYCFDKPKGSPFVGLARVVVATTLKRNLKISSESKDYCYHGDQGMTDIAIATPSKSFRFLNRAAQKVEGDIKPDGLIAKPWRVCTVQQVEDFKTLIRIMPLWSTSIFLSTPIGVISSLAILQALNMDRRLGPHFKLPASSVIGPVWTDFIVLQRISCVAENTSTAMISLVLGIAFYLSTALINLVQRFTRWLPDNIDNGRADDVYWMLVVIGVVNFGYYLVCAKLYEYQNVKSTDGSPDSDDDK
ncbi:hypothetical protein M0R45_016925 [Rubus argutus]|uniref:Uncharacterized protein n=1 Tax=Rubus argutus TaxID=59490 RepID=A0AAW1XVG8_RUBAR